MNDSVVTTSVDVKTCSIDEHMITHIITTGCGTVGWQHGNITWQHGELRQNPQNVHWRLEIEDS